MSSVVIIGAGLAGLATACHLARSGHRITVVESADHVGGMAGQRTEAGFTFDLGPTVLTMPDLIERTLRAAGGDLGDLPLRRLDPAYRAFFADGSHLDIWSDHDQMTEQIRRECSAADAAAFEAYAAWLADLYALEMPHFIDRNFDAPWDLVRRPVPAARLLTLGAFGRLHRKVGRQFSDDRLRRVFSFQALYAGLSPHQALSIYAVIAYMDAVKGVYFPVGGMHAVPLALAAAAQRAGVDIRLSTPARGLTRDTGGLVSGVVTDAGVIAADAVVCTIDVPTAYRTVLRDLRRPLSLRAPAFSPSAVVWHVGARGSGADPAMAPVMAPVMAHHNIHFGGLWREPFEDLLVGKRLMRDPSRLVTVPSVTDPGRAAPGCSTLYVLEPVPHLPGSALNWEHEDTRDAMRDRLQGFLTRSGYPSQIVAEHLVTPADWAAQGLTAGTPFSLAHLFRQTGPFRTRNAPRSAPGVVLAGAGTTPGVGVPMVLISGRLAAQRVVTYLAGRS
ncbi:MAG: phytoene desaturase [Austwickia sp.]|nr:phytoene desaturase [Austwickia sp.]MBK8437819.1 phytoene desaturase [Austwickia sp.]MBK9100126.1 phytoene desaturase [Austwickia sp.]